MCPASIYLEDADGNRVGPNEHGSIDELLPGSLFVVNEDQQHVFIVDAKGPYRVCVKGLGEGTAMLEVITEHKGKKTNVFYPPVRIDATSIGEFTIDSPAAFSLAPPTLKMITGGSETNITPIVTHGGLPPAIAAVADPPSAETDPPPPIVLASRTSALPTVTIEEGEPFSITTTPADATDIMIAPADDAKVFDLRLAYTGPDGYIGLPGLVFAMKTEGARWVVVGRRPVSRGRSYLYTCPMFPTPCSGTSTAHGQRHTC